MKYAFIEVEKAIFPVLILCQVLGVARSGFYAWLGRLQSPKKKQDAALSQTIADIHQQSRRAYGSPRIHAELRARDCRVSKKRVARLMREQDLQARRKKRFKAIGTQTDPSLGVAPNVLARDFSRSTPDAAWVGDTTYVHTSQGWLYLAVLLDLHSRRVVGWAMSSSNDRALVLQALAMAVDARGPSVGLLHHSDRGSQYACHDYRRALEEHGFTCSMSRKGNCWDNAVAESFFATLKTELNPPRPFATLGQARHAIFEYIEVFYNRQRRHSLLGYLSPADFETQMSARLPQLA